MESINNNDDKKEDEQPKLPHGFDLEAATPPQQIQVKSDIEIITELRSLVVVIKIFKKLQKHKHLIDKYKTGQSRLLKISNNKKEEEEEGVSVSESQDKIQQSEEFFR